MIVVIACVYEHLFTTYHLIYAFFSVAWWGDLPWKGCQHRWNDDLCSNIYSLEAYTRNVSGYRENVASTDSPPSFLVPVPATQQFFE